jgi:hypothetical protein
MEKFDFVCKIDPSGRELPLLIWWFDSAGDKDGGTPFNLNRPRDPHTCSRPVSSSSANSMESDDIMDRWDYRESSA